MVLSRIRKARDGNVAVISALTMMPIIIAAGGALDLVVSMNKLSEVRQATHSAVLALANLNNAATDASFGQDSDPDYASYVKQMMYATVANYNSMNFSDFAVDYESGVGYKNFTVKAEGYVETNFLRMAGVEKIPFSYSASALQRTQTAEISLVLDISSSMSGTRLPTLRDSAKSFVDLVLDSADENSTSISVVPFGGTVNLGPHIFNQFAADVDDEDTITNPSQAEYEGLDNAHTSTKYRFTNGYHGAYYCLDFPSEDYNDPDALLEPLNYSQVPSFYKWSDFHNWCPTTGSESVFISQDKDSLHQVLDRMSLSDGTGTDIGVLWGYKALSPNWRGKFDTSFAERPLDHDSATNLKAMVIMTDGGITFQVRPKDANLDSTHTNRTSNYAPLDWDQPNRRGGQHGNKQNENVLYATGNKNPDTFDINGTRKDGVAHFLRVCHHARENNIVVYTISFNLSENSWANNVMKACASDASKHYNVYNLDLEGAFESIAGSISALRMTG